MGQIDKTTNEVQRDMYEGLDNQPKETIGWNDLRVSVSATQANGSNAPTDALFKNDGNEIPGTAYALSFLSTTQGNLNLPDNVVFNTASDFTFGFWLRPQVGTQNNIECMRKNGAFDIDFVGADQLQLDPSGLSSVISSIPFNRGGWNWIVVQHDTGLGEIRLYINNQLGALITGVMSDSSNNFQFNRQETLYDVDYIEYWDTILTSGELSNRYANGVGTQLLGNEVGLKGLWELNDGSGTTAVEKTGIVSDGTITGGTEGTQWDWVGGHVGNTSAGSRGVILKYFSPDIENELYFEVQFPHTWKEGSTIRPHLHFVPNTDGGVGEQVRWGLEFSWANVADVFGDTTTIYATTNNLGEDLIKNKHYIASFGDVDATGMTLSSMIVARLFRDSTDVTDTFPNFAGLLEIDIHFQIDQERGSRQEFIK